MNTFLFLALKFGNLTIFKWAFLVLMVLSSLYYLFYSSMLTETCFPLAGVIVIDTPKVLIVLRLVVAGIICVLGFPVMPTAWFVLASCLIFIAIGLAELDMKQFLNSIIFGFLILDVIGIVLFYLVLGGK